MCITLVCPVDTAALPPVSGRSAVGDRCSNACSTGDVHLSFACKYDTTNLSPVSGLSPPDFCSLLRDAIHY